MKTVCIIPARAGSKGIIKKNLQYIGGVPLIVHSINAAINSSFIDHVFVTTDDIEISEISKFHGASEIVRPKRLGQDKSSSESALLHALTYIENEYGFKPDLMVFLQCTSPLTTSEDIDNVIKKLLDEDADTAFSATEFHYFLWKNNKKSDYVGINHDKRERKLRQYKDKEYLENGAVYVMKTDGFKNHKHRFFGKTVISEMPKERCLEIDEPMDLEVAEILIRYNKEKNKLNKLPKKISGVVFDFDGVFTNNSVILSEIGVESVTCDRSDGMGVELLKNLEVPMVVISSEKNKVVTQRCKKLKLPVLNGVKNKIHKLKEWQKKNKLERKGLIYVGNDINDLECLKYVACGVCVEDSNHGIKKYSDLILDSKGGKGAVRELTDLILLKYKNDK